MGDRGPSLDSLSQALSLGLALLTDSLGSLAWAWPCGLGLALSLSQKMFKFMCGITFSRESLFRVGGWSTTGWECSSAQRPICSELSPATLLELSFLSR